MTDTILAFDIGTTSVKIVQFTPELRQVACVREESALNRSGKTVEAPPERYLDAVRRGLSRLPERGSAAAVAVTTQGETLIPVDGDGRPLCDAIVWLDSRADREAEELRGRLDEREFYETTGLPAVGGALPLAKLLWLRRERPEIFSAARKFLLLEDYLIFWLTGRMVTEKSLLTSTGYFDIRRDCLWEKALAEAGVGPERIPEALECGVPAGKILPERAAELGLSPRAVVVTAAMDQTAAALAAGRTEPGAVTETTGTALVVTACTGAPEFRPGHRTVVYRHAEKGKYLYLLAGNTAGMALGWFRDEFCRDMPGEEGYALLDGMAARVPRGCGGLVFLPYLSGCVEPDFLPGATGCFYGVRLSSTRAHFARAVMESAACQLADFLDRLRDLGCEPRGPVISLGGGARSGLWMQMMADFGEHGFSVPFCREASAAGAALLAARGSGLLAAGALPAVGGEKRYEPDASGFAACREQRSRTHRLYETLKPLYEQEMQSI